MRMDLSLAPIHVCGEMTSAAAIPAIHCSGIKTAKSRSIRR